MKTLPYGSWPSALTASQLSSGTLRFRDLGWDGSRLYWLETRPLDKGRQAIMSQAPDESVREASPQDTNARTRVHEYGGGSFVAHQNQLYYANFSDQRWLRCTAFAGAEPLTEVGPRFADGVVDATRERLILVGEEKKQNFLAAVSLTGGLPQKLVEGSDFYACPRVSPDGSQLAWMQWNHPHMPWDESEIWLGTLTKNGEITDARRLAGGPGESVGQPEFSPGGRLHFLSDRTGWWNLYRCDGAKAIPLCPKSAEFGLPLWVFGESTYAFLGEDRLIVSYQTDGQCHLALIEAGKLRDLPCPHTDIHLLKSSGTEFAYVGGRPDGPQELVRSDGKTFQVIRRSHSIEVKGISKAEPFTFKGYNNQPTHGFLYRPQNPDFEGPKGTLPPCLVVLHGGPTGHASTGMELGYQYWTSRGFAVADINYGGSTGFGRAYRERLRGAWGVVDVEDAKAAVRHLMEQKIAGQFAIRGGSAGGYTTLCALLTPTPFKAGASYYGVSDLRLLIKETHKFESRYDDFLIDPDPSEALLDERSPLQQAARLRTPVIFFQGLDDEVVPPNQSEILFEAAKRQGVLTAYVPFVGEGHGFRRADSQQRALECELYFYSRVFGFSAPEPVPPLPLANA